MARAVAGARPVHAPVLIADRDGESRAALTALLERLGCVVDQAESGDEALALARANHPALVVLDVHLPVTSGYEVCRELRETFGETLPIMFLSDSRREPTDEIVGLLLGADDYLAKPVATDQFLARVRRLLARSPMRPRGSGLTPRELDVLRLLVDGRRPNEIADDLCITPKTTSTHIEHILTKLGAHSQAQAVAFAIRDDLVRAA
jgi:DNA-binding NarL/FixJ family response regulator